MKNHIILVSALFMLLFGAGMVSAQNTSGVNDPELQMQVNDSYSGLEFSPWSVNSHFLGSALFVEDDPGTYHVRMNNGENEFLLVQVGVTTKTSNDRITSTYSIDKIVVNDNEMTIKKNYSLVVRNKSGNEITQRFKVDGKTQLKVTYDPQTNQSVVKEMKNGSLKEADTADGFLPIILYTQHGKVIATVNSNN